MDKQEAYKLLQKKLGDFEKEYRSDRQVAYQPPLNREDPYAPVHMGAYELKVGGRAYSVYIPSSLRPPGAGVFIFWDGGEQEHPENNQEWRKIAELMGCVLIFLFSQDGWDKEQLESHWNYANQVYADALADDLYHIGFFYGRHFVLGIGSGAYPAAVCSLMWNRRLSGFSIFGDCRIEKEFLEAVHTYFSDMIPDINGGNMPIPAWIFGSTGNISLLAELLKNAGCSGDKSQNGNTFIWKMAFSTDGEIRFNPMEDGEPPAELIISFLMNYRRTDSLSGWIQKKQISENMGLVKYETILEGRHRYWLIATPLKMDKKKKYPLVLALHGYTDTGEGFAERSGWSFLAQKYDIIVAFPTAYPYDRYQEGGRLCWLPAWNCGIYPRDDNLDDVAFLKIVLKETQERYAINKSKIYVTGHSNGSRMTQKLMREFPVFAAYGPVGATETARNGKPFPFREPGTRPTWCIMSQYDVGDAARLEPDSDTFKYLNYMATINQCDLTQTESYTDENFSHRIYKNKSGKPILRFSMLKNFPHAYPPKIAEILWNYFRKWETDKDGEPRYRGIVEHRL